MRLHKNCVITFDSRNFHLYKNQIGGTNQLVHRWLGHTVYSSFLDYGKWYDLKIELKKASVKILLKYQGRYFKILESVIPPGQGAFYIRGNNPVDLKDILIKKLSPQQAWLYKNGKTQGKIFFPAKGSRITFFAVCELQDFLQKITGTKIPIAWNRDGNAGDDGIYLQVKKQKPVQGFTIEQNTDCQNKVIITGNSEIALLYGVYEYLRSLGCEWFAPGKIGENIPKLENIAIKNYSKEFQPDFKLRIIDFSPSYYSSLNDTDFPRQLGLWILRNRFMFFEPDRNFSFNAIPLPQPSGHNLHEMALKGIDIKKEPERLAMVTRKGKKIRTLDHAQICFTNEKNVKMSIKSIVDYFKEREKSRHKRFNDFDDIVDFCPISLEDCKGICECKKCKNIAGDGSFAKDRLVWNFMNKVAKGVAEQCPGKKISLYAPYWELSRPPENVKIENNICAFGCRQSSWRPYYINNYPLGGDFHKNLQMTAKAGAQLCNYDYLIRYAPQILNVLDAIKTYREMGSEVYFIDVMQRNTLNWQILWVLMNYSWDSRCSPRKLLAFYCEKYYGKNGGRAVSNILRYFDLPDVVNIMTPEVIKQGRFELGKAVAEANGKEKKRLEIFRLSFETHARLAETLRAYYHALNIRTPKAEKKALKAFDNYEKFWKENDIFRINSIDTLTRLIKLKKNFKIVTAVKAEKRKSFKPEHFLIEVFEGVNVPPNIKILYKFPEIWKFRLDPDDIGIKNGWQQPNFKTGSKWHNISTWNYYTSQGYPNHAGVFWYRLKFEALQLPKGKKIFMRVGAVDDNATVYVNGRKAGSPKPVIQAWNKSFAFEVTDLLKPGSENVIAVRGCNLSSRGGMYRPAAIYTK
jgi:hypothetical protein